MTGFGTYHIDEDGHTSTWMCDDDPQPCTSSRCTYCLAEIARREAARIAAHRDAKTAIHKTRGGSGEIARLRGGKGRR